MINIQVNEKDLAKILSALEGIEKKVQRAAVRTLTKEAAMEFADMLRENIKTQEFNFKPPGKWKEAYPDYHPNEYWWFLGTVLKSIEVRPILMSAKMNTIYKVGLAYEGSF